MAGLRKRVDWEGIQNDYRAGNKSLRVLGIKHGVSHVAVKKKADREGWVKDLPERIKVVTGVQVNKAASVNHEQKVKCSVGAPSKKTPELMEAIFEAIASGKSTRVVCEENGITPGTFFKWAQNDREFLYQYTRAKRFCADFFVEDIIEIADDSSRDTYTDEKGRTMVNQGVLARSKIRIEARKWAAMRLNPRKYNLAMLESTDDKPALHRIEISFVSGDGVVSAGRTFDATGKVAQPGAISHKD